MTEASDAWKELQRRASESTFSGVRADSDDLLGDADLREGNINPNATGGKGQGGGSGMMPPMMMGGAGGAGVGGAGAAGAQGAMGGAMAGQMGANAAGAAGAAGAMGAMGRGMVAPGAAPGAMGAGIGPGGMGPGGVPGPGMGGGPNMPGVMAAGGAPSLNLPEGWQPGDPILPGDPRHPGGDIGAIMPGDPAYGDLVPGWSGGIDGPGSFGGLPVGYDPNDPSTWGSGPGGMRPGGFDPNDPSTWGSGPGGIRPSDGSGGIGGTGNWADGGGRTGGSTPITGGGWQYGDPIMPGDPRHPGGSTPIMPNDPRYRDIVNGGYVDGGSRFGGDGTHSTNPDMYRQYFSDTHRSGIQPNPGDGTTTTTIPKPPTDTTTTSIPKNPTDTTTTTTKNPTDTTTSETRTRQTDSKDTSFTVEPPALRDQAKRWEEQSDAAEGSLARMELPKDFGFAQVAFTSATSLGTRIQDWTREASSEFSGIASSLRLVADNYEAQEQTNVQTGNQVGK